MTGKIFGIPLVVIVLALAIAGIILVPMTMFNAALHDRIDGLQAENAALREDISKVMELRKEDLFEIVQPSDAVTEEAEEEAPTPVVRPRVTPEVQDNSDNE